MFIYAIVGEIKEKKKKELFKIQEKFNIDICTIPEYFIKLYYNLPNCKCGFIIIIDNNNKVRFANSGFNKHLATIINQELNRTIN